MHYNNCDNLVLLADGYPISRVSKKHKTIFILLEIGYDILYRNEDIIKEALSIAKNNILKYKVILFCNHDIVYNCDTEDISQALDDDKKADYHFSKTNLDSFDYINKEIVNSGLKNIDLIFPTKSLKATSKKLHDKKLHNKKVSYFLNTLENTDKMPKKIPKNIKVSFRCMLAILIKNSDNNATKYFIKFIKNSEVNQNLNYYSEQACCESLLKIKPTLVKEIFKNLTFLSCSNSGEIKALYNKNFQVSRLFKA